MIKIPVIGVASGIAANILGSEEGPQVLAQSSFNEAYRQKGLQLVWDEILAPAAGKNKMDLVQEISLRIAQKTQALVQKKQKFLVMGGDHACAVGTWSGVATLNASASTLGLIWIDAHLDCHTPDTTQTGNIHGMPAASLLGVGDKRLTHILQAYPKVLPQHLYILGARSFEVGEQALVQRLNVRVYYMEEIQRRGFAEVFAEVLSQLRRSEGNYGVSLDLDAIDPMEAPGVSTPVPGGISAEALCAAFNGLQADLKFVGLEIAEFNPSHDKNQRTERLIFDILSSCFSKR